MHGGAKYVDLFDLTFEEKKKEQGFFVELEKVSQNIINTVKNNASNIFK
jgi:hypothetical protein